jgi:prepilin-type N-terminal cleavage/methylation domain-containing protein
VPTLTRPSGAPPRARRRRAFTLVELAVALALAGVVCGAVGAVLLRQQRFYHAAGITVAARQQVQQALAVLPADLGALSTAALEVTAAAPDSIQLRATIGGGLACAVGALALDLPSPGVTGGTALLAWSAAPRAGDTVAVYDPGDSTRAAGWTEHAVAALDPADGASCADAFGGGPGVPAAASGYRLRVEPSTPLPATVGPRAPVRLVRHVRYKRYRAGDARWYLGYSDYRAPGGWATVQPVSGPYAPPGGTPLFRYLDADGTPVTDVTRIALVVVTATAPAANGELVADSLSVALRGGDA